MDKKDIFRLVIKNDYLSNNEFVQLLIDNSAHIKEVYKAVKEDKEGFRNFLNEKRNDNPNFEKLAKSLDIRKTTKGKKE